MVEPVASVVQPLAIDGYATTGKCIAQSTVV